MVPVAAKSKSTDEAPVALGPEEVAATVEGRSFAVEGNDLSAYVGVDAEYMTYSNPTEAPHADGTDPEPEPAPTEPPAN
jgi:hypothetical protein